MATLAHPVLLSDPDLAEGLDERRRRAALRECIAAEAVIDDGPWKPEHGEGAMVRGGIGLLVLDGLLIRRVGSEGRFGAELLGPRDLLRPWEHDGEDTMLPFEVSFHVVERLRVALLDTRFAARLGPYPEVTGALVGRAMQRARALAVNLAIAHHPRVDRRLLLLLWHLAERWGRVHPDGVHIPFHVTHAVLGDLIACRRPSVTGGVQQLQREGRIGRVDGRYVLYGEPPGDLDAHASLGRLARDA